MPDHRVLACNVRQRRASCAGTRPVSATVRFHRFDIVALVPSMTTLNEPSGSHGGIVNSVLSALFAIGSGAGLWIWAARAAGKVEAWDGPFYFSRVVPALALVAAACGFLAPRRAWRWPWLIYLSQFIVLMGQAKPPIGPLAPLGFVLMALLALVNVVPAYLGAFVRRQWDRRLPREG